MLVWTQTVEQDSWMVASLSLLLQMFKALRKDALEPGSIPIYIEPMPGGPPPTIPVHKLDRIVDPAVKAGIMELSKAGWHPMKIGFAFGVKTESVERVIAIEMAQRA